MFQTLFDIIRSAVEIVRPPERINVAEAAEKYRRVYNPGQYVGPWKNDLTPYMVEPQEELTSLDFTGMVFVGPARTGKSDIFFNWLEHTVVCDPADMMMVHMTQATARDWSQGDLARFLRHNPLVEEKLLPGRHARNVHDIHFTSGMRLLVKWPTISELSGKTIPRLWLADYDRMPLDVDGEGAAFDLARKRAGTFKRYGMTVAESSPGHLVKDPKWMPKSKHEAPPCDGLLSLYNRGDRRRFYWQCPNCQQTYEPDFSMFDYPTTDDIFDAASQVKLVCPHCDYAIAHDPDEYEGTPGKFQMNLAGRWVKDGQVWKPDGSIVGTAVRSDIASFWLKGPPAGLTDWFTIVSNYLKAKQEFDQTGSEEALKSTLGLDQGLPYVPKSLNSDRVPEELKARAKKIEPGQVPLGVRFLIATIDVQKNRFEVQVQGVGPGGDIWVVERFSIRKSQRIDADGERYWVSPGAYPEDWRLLVSQVMKKTYPLIDGSGRRMRIKHVLCDSGGETGVATQSLNFWRWLRSGPPPDADDDDGWEPGLHLRFQLIRGTGNRGAPRILMTYPDAMRKDRHSGARGDVPILQINTNVLKDLLNVMLDRLDPNGGRISFPDKMTDQFYQELTVEVKNDKGIWENPRNARNETWDLLVYCLAAGLMLRPSVEQIDWSDPPGWADEWDHNDLVFNPAAGATLATDRQPAHDLKKLSDILVGND